MTPVLADAELLDLELFEEVMKPIFESELPAREAGFILDDKQLGVMAAALREIDVAGSQGEIASEKVKHISN